MSRDKSAAEELILFMPSIALKRFKAEVQIFFPGVEQLWGDLQTIPKTDVILLDKIFVNNL